MRLPAYIIHLERAKSRRANVDRLCENLGPGARIVAAVDGASLERTGQGRCRDQRLFPPYPFPLRTAEEATFLSHRACWQRLLDDGHDAALVIEDDVVLEPEFHSASALVAANLTERAFVRFPCKKRERSLSVIASDGAVQLYRPQVVGLGMQAQIVTRGAAERLLETSGRCDRPVDAFVQLTWIHGADVLSVWRSGVTEISGALGGSMIHRGSGGIEWLRRETLLPIYRMALVLQSLRLRHDS